MYAKENFNALTDAATIAVDFNISNNHKVTLAGTGRTLTFANGVEGETYLLKVIEDATGSRTITSWPSTVKWSGGTAPTLTATAAKADVFQFIYDGVNYIGSTIGLNY